MAVKARSDVITLVRVNDGAKGDQGIPGKDGKSPTVSVSKSGTVTTIVVTNADGSKTTQTVNDGVNGTPGAKGADGKTPYFHVKYSNDGGKTFTANSGETVGTYIGTCTDYNSSDPTSVSSYTWAKIKGDTGTSYWVSHEWIDVSASTYDQDTYYPVVGSKIPSNGTHRIKTSVQLNSGTKPKWSTHNAGFSVDLDIQTQASGWGTTHAVTYILLDDYDWCVSGAPSPVSFVQKSEASAPVLYLRGGGKYYVETTYSCNWSIKTSEYYTYQGTSKKGPVSPTKTRPAVEGKPIKGDKGDKGDTGATGAKGEDGISPTVSVSKTGSTTTISITDKNGTHTQTVLDGTNGTPGAKGADGRTTYFHVKYSNDGGKTFTANSGETAGTYIGTCTDYNSADPTSVGSYTWAKIKGDTGISVTSTIDEWYLSTSSTILSGGSWSSTRQAWSSGHYYWRRVKTTYSNNTSKNTPSDNGYYDAAMTAAVSDANSAKSTADDAKKVATNYISTDSSGLMVANLTNKTETPSTATGYNTYISSDGLHVRKGLTDLANFLSSGEQIGLENESHLNLDYHSFKMIDQDGNTYVYISDLRNKDGYYEVTDNFTGDGTTKEFLTSFYVNTSRTVTVTIDGTATTDYSVSNAIHLTFNTAPADGAQIVVNYQTSSKYTKAFTLGMRKEDSSIGTFSYAFGSNVDASGYESYASGYGTTASGRYSYAEGYSTIASGNCSHAQGYASIASGGQAFATGYSNVASGYGSYAGGVRCNSIGDVSFTHGRYLYAKATSQVVFGQYNADDANAMLIIGNGSSDSARSNSFTVSTTGLVCSAGGVVTGGDMSASGILAISSNSAYRFMCGGGDSFVWIDCRDSSNTMKNNVVLYPTYTALRSTTINGTLNGYNIVEQNKNGPWPKISTVNSDGGMEVGRYIDFHSSSGSTEDHTGRIGNFGSEFDFSQAIKAPNFIGNWNGINLAQCARVQAIAWAKTLDCGLKHGIVIISDYRAYLFWYSGTSPNMGISYKAIYGGDANTTFTVLNKTGTGNCWRITVAQNSSITVIGRY